MYYVSIETILLVSLLGFWVVLFCLGSIFNNGKQDNKNKKQPYVSRRQRLKEYNRKERKNK